MISLLLVAALNNNLDDLIARVMTTYGGAAAWSKVTGFRETGTVTPAMRPGEGKLTREWQPGKLRVEIVYPTNTEVRELDGDHGTQNGKESTGMGLDAMRLQAARLALPQLLIEKRAVLRQLEDSNRIEIPLTSSLTLTLQIDPATGHIIRSTGKAAGIEFSTSYSDFRTVDGLLFAFREENSAGEVKTGTNQIAKVELSRSR